jgi:hypothetical protein
MFVILPLFIYFFVCSLFNDPFTVTKTTWVENESVMCEWWIGKLLEGSGHGQI